MIHGTWKRWKIQIFFSISLFLKKYFVIKIKEMKIWQIIAPKYVLQCTYSFDTDFLVLKIKILMSFMVIDSVQTKKVHKFKVKLSYARISEERDVILLPPVVYVVHTTPGVSENKIWEKWVTFIECNLFIIRIVGPESEHFVLLVKSIASSLQK